MSTVIRCREHGPLIVDGPVTIVDSRGRPIALPAGKPAVALCRCGQSANKPFCDGSHRGCGFLAPDPATPGEQP